MAKQTTHSFLDGVSKEDCTLLARSFKDEKFRQLLCEYAREVNDPVNRKQFEEEVIQYEKECGVEAVFVCPTPGFAFALTGNGDSGYVNVCSSDVVQKPNLQVGSDVNGTKGPSLSLPHVLPKPRPEIVTSDHHHHHHHHQEEEGRSRKEQTRKPNNALTPTLMYDVVFHPEALQLACKFPSIKQTLVDTCVDALRKHYSVKIGRVEMIDDKPYIGTPAQSVIKRKLDKENVQDYKKIANKNNRTSRDIEVENGSEVKSGETQFVEPKYKLKHVRKMDIQDFALNLIPQNGSSSGGGAYQPQTLELEVMLPGVVKAAQVSADIQHQSVLLTTDSVPKYKLEVPIRYPIDEDKSTAKFDVSAQTLTLTLPVVPLNNNRRNSGGSSGSNEQSVSPPSDSGIECEFDARTNGDCSDNVSEGSLTPQLDDDDGDDVKDGDQCVVISAVSEDDNVFESPSPPLQPDVLIPSPNSSQQNEEINKYVNDSENDGECPSLRNKGSQYVNDGVKDGECVATVPKESAPDSPSLVHPADVLTLPPNYTLQQSNESMHVSLCCQNVLPSSVKVTRTDDTNGRIELSTIGGGQTTIQYSLRIDTSPHMIAASGLTYREEEGKVVLVVKKAVNELWEALKIGHGDTLTTINLPGINPAGVKDNKQTMLAEGNKDIPNKTAGVSRPPRMSRTVSMCETEGAGHPFRLRGPTCSWPRGILKRRVRSLSESQVGTFSPSSPLAPIDSSSLDIDVFESKSKSGDEEGEESVEESVASSYGTKKSVRFNKVVSRQLFRSNSSILSQRAKNQRKATKKLRAKARRESLSDKDVGTSGDSDITTDAATDDDTDGVSSSNTTELDDNSNVESDGTAAGNTEGNTVGNTGTLTTDMRSNVISKLTKNITNTNNKSKCNANNKNNKTNTNNNKSKSSNNNSNSDKSSNSNNNNDNGDNNNDNSNSDFVCENENKVEKEKEEEKEEDNSDFIIKTSKKKRRKNKKHKVPNFQPSNVLIFQLDMEK